MREEGQVQSPADVGLAMQAPHQHVRNRDFVYRPASTHTVQFKRKYSLREGYKVLLEQLNSELPWDEERIQKIGYA
jgi:hypothetical protein